MGLLILEQHQVSGKICYWTCFKKIQSLDLVHITVCSIKLYRLFNKAFRTPAILSELVLS